MTRPQIWDVLTSSLLSSQWSILYFLTSEIGNQKLTTRTMFLLLLGMPEFKSAYLFLWLALIWDPSGIANFVLLNYKWFSANQKYCINAVSFSKIVKLSLLWNHLLTQKLVSYLWACWTRSIRVRQFYKKPKWFKGSFLFEDIGEQSYLSVHFQQCALVRNNFCFSEGSQLFFSREKVL